ncbi:MAG: YCF48-related protein [Parvibaculum sp.]|nr:YCF48-related protein [Parvibaculum sp.]|tara:strand:+ start:1276 stop:2340 length:1065 start_codon:yes stop_codon:yes gene_type:complete
MSSTQKSSRFGQFLALTGAVSALAFALVAAPLGAAPALAADESEAVEFSTPSHLASHDLLLSATMAGTRMVAVGQFGHVIHSDDGGKTWVQAKSVPTQVTLTSVSFVSDKIGYAGGHDSTVLRTEDAGDTWTSVYHNIDSQAPIMTVYFTDENHGFAMGAFSFVIETSDGGKTWEQRELIPGSNGDSHLNKAFATNAGTILVSAEFGKVFRSTDKGVTFSEITSGYEGSFWGGMSLKDGSVLVYGMRGNVYRSTDDGLTWAKINSGTDKSVSGGWELDNGTIVLVGLQGYVGYSTNGGTDFTEVTRADRLGYVAVLPGADNTISVFGEPGVKSQPDEASKAAEEVGFKFSTSGT